VKFSIERIPVVSGRTDDDYVGRVKEVKIIDPLTVQVITDGAAPTLPNDFIRLFIVSAKAAAGLTKESANAAFNSGKAACWVWAEQIRLVGAKGDLVLDRFDDWLKEPWAKHIRRLPMMPRVSRSLRRANLI